MRTPRQILVWFNDRPARECYYSLHNMARTGTFLGKKIGEWFGPSTAAYVLRYERGRVTEARPRCAC